MDFNKVAVITVAYVIINLFLFFFNYALIHSPYTLGPSPEFSVRSYFFTNLLIGFITGVLGGVLLVSVNNHLFRRRSFKFAMLSTLIAYSFIFILVTSIATFANLLGPTLSGLLVEMFTDPFNGGKNELPKMEKKWKTNGMDFPENGKSHK